MRKLPNIGEQGMPSSCLCPTELAELSAGEGNLCCPVSCPAAAHCQHRMGDRAGSIRKRKAGRSSLHRDKQQTHCLAQQWRFSAPVKYIKALPHSLPLKWPWLTPWAGPEDFSPSRLFFINSGCFQLPVLDAAPAMPHKPGWNGTIAWADRIFRVHPFSMLRVVSSLTIPSSQKWGYYLEENKTTPKPPKQSPSPVKQLNLSKRILNWK